MTRSLAVVLAVGSVALVSARGPQQDGTRADAARMEQKLAVITSRATLPVAALGAPVPTSFTDSEVNAYFRFNGHDRLPEGVLDPQVTILGGGRVEAHAVVDLDAVRKAQPQSMLAALVLHGSVDVKVSALISGANGKGTLQIDSASAGGIVIPQTLLQSVVSQYTRTPEMPNGFQLDKPFDLPANIRDLRMQRGTMTIVQ